MSTPQVVKPGAMTAVMRTVAVATGPRIPRIAVVRGGKITDEYLIREGGSVTVGGNEDARIVVPGLASSFELLERVGDRYFLRFTAEMNGRVSTQNGVATLADLRSSAHPVSNNAWRVPLTEDARGKVVIGDTSFLFQIVPRPPLAPTPQLPITVLKGMGLDWSLTILVAFSFLLHFGIAGALYSDWFDPVVSSDFSVSGLVDILPKLAQPPVVEENAPVADNSPSVPSTPKNTTTNTKTTTTNNGPRTNTTSRNNGGPKTSDAEAARLAARADQMGIDLLAAKSGGPAVANALGREVPPVDMSSAAEKAVGVSHSNSDLKVATGGPIVPGKSSLASVAGDTHRVGNGEKAGEANNTLSPVVETQPPSTVGGTISDADRVVAKLRPRFKKCYQDGLNVNPTMSGKAVFVAKVGPNGEVSSTDIASNDGLSPQVTACISKVISHAEFTANGSAATVRIPVSMLLQGK